jgi:hypothetical protein
MTASVADTDRVSSSRDYWLGHCEGFRVEDRSLRLGYVEEVVGAEDEPEELVVRGGLFAGRLYRSPVDAIQEIQPRAERILVRPDREGVA